MCATADLQAAAACGSAVAHKVRSYRGIRSNGGDGGSGGVCGPGLAGGDALVEVATAILEVRKDRPDLGILLITHYQRLLDHLPPDHVHVLARGRILRSGDRGLALELEKRGYDWVTGAAA